MALGIVVDDAIVVGEDAVTHFENGKSPLDAAIAGAERMWVPVMTSSMTTLAAFIPLLLVGGEMGDVILALPTVLLCVIVASLIECFGVLPGHLKGAFEQMQRSSPSAFRQRFDAAFLRFRQRRFEPLVRRALDYPGATVCAAIGTVICTVSLIAAQHVGVAFVTGFDWEGLETNIEFSASATTAEKESFIGEVTRALNAVDADTANVNVVNWVTATQPRRVQQRAPRRGCSTHHSKFNTLLRKHATFHRRVSSTAGASASPSRLLSRNCSWGSKVAPTTVSRTLPWCCAARVWIR